MRGALATVDRGTLAAACSSLDLLRVMFAAMRDLQPGTEFHLAVQRWCMKQLCGSASLACSAMAACLSACCAPAYLLQSPAATASWTSSSTALLTRTWPTTCSARSHTTTQRCAQQPAASSQHTVVVAAGSATTSCWKTQLCRFFALASTRSIVCAPTSMCAGDIAALPSRC